MVPEKKPEITTGSQNVNKKSRISPNASGLARIEYNKRK